MGAIKKCFRCNTDFPIEEFLNKQGRRSYSRCRLCTKISKHEDYLCHQSKRYAKIREWVLANHDKARSHKMRWKERNREQQKIRQKELHAKNPDVRKASKKRTYQNEKQSPARWMNRILRSRLKNAFRQIRKKKLASHLDLISCSKNEFMLYIQSKFKSGMAWNNYGLKGWHLDHIVPISAFNLLDYDQQRKAFHYTNMQPLWWWENLKKGKNISSDFGNEKRAKEIGCVGIGSYVQ